MNILAGSLRILVSIYPEVGLLDHMVGYFILFYLIFTYSLGCVGS